MNLLKKFSGLDDFIGFEYIIYDIFDCVLISNVAKRGCYVLILSLTMF